MAERDLLIIDHETPIDVVIAVCLALDERYPGSYCRSDTGHVLHIAVDADTVAVEPDDDEPLAFVFENGEPREAQVGDVATHILVPIR